MTNEEFLNKIRGYNFEIIKNNKRKEYYNIPCSFDIENTSFYVANQLANTTEKASIMYEWSFAIYGYVTIGRTWEEFINLIDQIAYILKTDDNLHLIVYVHNLSHEFQFMRKWFTWNKVFSLDERKPVQAITDRGIEFRCSYKLSGYSLEKLGDQLLKYKSKKLVGGLNYDLIRHSKTPLSKEELQYCAKDVITVNCYIQELIEREGNISCIPLTKTGFVRKLCRHKCMYDNDDKYHTKYKKYRKLMSELTLDAETYSMLKRAFAGGFTHASPLYVFDTIENVKSYDFTSSYPYVMVTEKFPMSRFNDVELQSKKQFEDYLSTHCCLFELEVYDLESRVFFENYISESHCRELEEAEVCNGRVVSAKHLKITINEIDYQIIRIFYSWKNGKISNFKIAKKEYLPRDFVLSVLEMYERKTKLKDIPEYAIEYMKSKEDVNSLFGMTVTDICRDEITYTTEWNKTVPEIEEVLNSNNKSVKRFIYYPWGVWITAYARLNLFTGICEFKEDYLYSDTDSLKVINYEKHYKYIEKYNLMVRQKLKDACDFHKIDIALTEPKNSKGVIKRLGEWTDEGTYTRFKSLGAKRYLVEKDGKIEMTVAGLNKKTAVPYILQNYNDAFETFTERLYIPATYINKDGIKCSGAGKLTHTYIDEEQNGVVIDYLGNTCEYHELSSVHLEPSDYDFSITQQFIDYVFNIKQIQID